MTREEKIKEEEVLKLWRSLMLLKHWRYFEKRGFLNKEVELFYK